jgi:antitoxin (DNA-binding transcriptional repressor) of toxin-antitoxin stability system
MDGAPERDYISPDVVTEPAMTHTFTLREAKARLSHLLDLAAAGEVIEITRKGGKNDRFRLTRSGAPAFDRRPGKMKGEFVLPDDFDDEDPEINAAFYGGKLGD